MLRRNAIDVVVRLGLFLFTLQVGVVQASDPQTPANDGSDQLAAQQRKKPTPQARKKGRSGTPQPNAKARPDRGPSASNAAVSGDSDYSKFGIYARTAPRADNVPPVATKLPLHLQPGDRIALVGNTLLERMQFFGDLEALLHQRYPEHRLVVRNLAWSADTPDLQPRPENFADLEQHLTHEKIDVIFAAFGFNESFAGPDGVDSFKQSLADFVASVKRRAFNGQAAPRVVLISPIANENVPGVDAADLNNDRIKVYADAIRSVAAQQQVGFVDVYTDTKAAMDSGQTELTINGCHLTEAGYELFARTLFTGLFGEAAPASKTSEALKAEIVDKNRQYFRRYRPLNTFYYTGGRNKSYGYLDFLPAMQNFDIMTDNRDRRIWALAQGKSVSAKVDDSNLPPLPATNQSRGANRWMTADQELAEFKIDPRFEVTLFAGEEQFPDIAAPIQMRWDSQGRLWVSTSTTYPHVYPGNEPADKLVILEDTDGDGRADKSSVFADDLHIPLSFEFGDGGVYVSEMPHLTFIKDTDGDGRADLRRRVLSGFGTEDSHHALHDFAWTPDGDLIFRESIFHHSQVETPYGPVRQQNSGWFRFQPRDHRLISFGTYHSTNPWGVTFDDWGQHVASHPVFASAFHALDPPYPQQHPRPAELQAYSGVCGQEFVDFKTFPDELQGHFIKVRYKPTNRVEIHRWIEHEFGYDEQYVGDLIFSSNLSFIPVDIRYGPRGALYVCDWYNPIKGHAQYSLRDERRDRHSGRIWRITAKGHALQDPPQIADAPVADLLDILKRPEYRYRYWAKRELRERDSGEVKRLLDDWVAALDPRDPRFRHHQVEAVWAYRNVGEVNAELLREVLVCNDHHARAAAVRQLRYWHPYLPDALTRLNAAANDPNGLVRMEAAIAASYIGTKAALDAMLDVTKHPAQKHLAYAITCALGSHSLRRHWANDPSYNIEQLLRKAKRQAVIKEPAPNAQQAEFDRQSDLKKLAISCVPEKMLFTRTKFEARPGQPIKIVFTNPDATDHNLVFVKPGSLAEVGMAANDMARDPRNANSDFIPESKKHLIVHAANMIGPTRASRVHVLRFLAPAEPGIYPYVCTFPGHWVIMNGIMVVASDAEEAERLLAAREPEIVNQWSLADFANDLEIDPKDERAVMRGMQAFVKARCNQCHAVAGHGLNLGPDLTDVGKRFTGRKLLQQVLEPSAEINKKYQTLQFLLNNGKIISGVVTETSAGEYHIITNLLNPRDVTVIRNDEIDETIVSSVSSMPAGLVNVLTQAEILDLVTFLQAGGFHLPAHLDQHHQHHRHPQHHDGNGGE